METNLLFQFKKPYYITRSSGSEWIHWNKPYYRYNIYPQQQKLLFQIDQNFSSNLLVIYAAPAVKNVTELVNQKTNASIISSSNFIKCSHLEGHKRNTYIESGTHSIACSKPSKINNFNLIEELDLLGKDSKSNETNSQFIIKFRKEITNITYLDPYYGDSFRKINKEYEFFEKFPLLYSFIAMENFNKLTGIQWIIKVKQLK